MTLNNCKKGDRIRLTKVDPADIYQIISFGVTWPPHIRLKNERTGLVNSGYAIHMAVKRV